MLLYIPVAIILFGLLIFLHELGHFLTAKVCGVRVNEFAVCMGPVLASKTIGETKYSLRAIPIGGYCAMEGEDSESADPRSYSASAVWKRFLILIAGAVSNFLFGLLILLLLFSTANYAATPRIESFEPTATIAAETGLQVGDTIYSIDGRRIYRYADIGTFLSQNGETHEITVLRGGEKTNLGSVPFVAKAFRNADGTETIRYGITFATEKMTLPIALHSTWFTALDFVRLIWMGLADLIRGAVGFDQVTGTVGIVRAIAQTGESAPTVQIAFRSIAYFSAFLAVNLAVTNLLPIPALDGGKAFTLAVVWFLEKILKRKINPKYEMTIHAVGMVLLLILIAVITLKDILSIFM